jgi:hypothetical protein
MGSCKKKCLSCGKRFEVKKIYKKFTREFLDEIEEESSSSD